jgi:hypothetical protein
MIESTELWGGEMEDWRELASGYQDRQDRDLKRITDRWPGRLAMAQDDDKAGVFEGMPDTLARRVALLGPEYGRIGVAGSLAALESVLVRMDPEPGEDDAPYTVTVLSMVNAPRCCGSAGVEGKEWAKAPGSPAVAESDDDRERRWLTAAANSTGRASGRQGRGQVALAAAGAGLPEAALAAAGDEARPFDPEAVYGCDLAPLAAHLAGAQQAGAGIEGVRPAWDWFLRDFLAELDAEAVQWLDLLWAARAVYAVLGDTPVGEVGATLHRELLG